MEPRLGRALANHLRSRADILGRKTAPDGVIDKVIGILPQSFVMPMEVRSDIHSGQGNASLFLLISPSGLRNHNRRMTMNTGL